MRQGETVEYAEERKRESDKKGGQRVRDRRREPEVWTRTRKRQTGEKKGKQSGRNRSKDVWGDRGIDSQ